MFSQSPSGSSLARMQTSMPGTGAPWWVPPLINAALIIVAPIAIIGAALTDPTWYTIKWSIVLLLLWAVYTLYKIGRIELMHKLVVGDWARVREIIDHRIRGTRLLHRWRRVMVQLGGVDEQGRFYAPPRTVNVNENGWSIVLPLGRQAEVNLYEDVAGTIARGMGVDEVKVVQLTQSYVAIQAQLTDFLEGAREAADGQELTVRMGRMATGEDATINVADSSHVIFQGMTRSGKSAACYVLTSQLVGLPQVQLWGIDPNRVFLDPLAAATNRARFSLGSDPVAALELLREFVALMDQRMDLLGIHGIDKLENFEPEIPLCIFFLEEYGALIRAADAHDSGAKPADKVKGKIKSLVGRLVSEGAKAGVRVVMIVQRADAEIVDGATRAQFGTRVTLAVDNGDAVRMLHPGAEPETVDSVRGFSPGRCLFWQHRRESVAQMDYLTYAGYRNRILERTQS